MVLTPELDRYKVRTGGVCGNENQRVRPIGLMGTVDFHEIVVSHQWICMETSHKQMAIQITNISLFCVEL